MNGACESQPEQLCGCCQGIGKQTPEPITNRPALSAIAYRVGTHATFKSSMLAELSDPELPALVTLRARDDSDFSIALVDAWAVALDILSFYQERIANESYLRTAVDQRSMIELARLVGYKPSPGVAASAFLAFTISSAPGSPDNVPIPAGSRVQSVPAPGQSPQVFETSSDLTARIAYNALPAQTTLPWGLNAGDLSTWISGTSNNLNPGDGIFFVSSTLYNSPASGPADFHIITKVVINSNAQSTQVTWDAPLASWVGQNNPGVFLYVFRKRAALYGVQAPPLWTLVSLKSQSLSIPDYPGDWSFQYAAGSSQINLDASYTSVTASPPQGSSPPGPPQWTVLSTTQSPPGLVELFPNASQSPPGLIALLQVMATAETGPMLYTLTAKTTQLTLANGQTLSPSDLVQDYMNLASEFGWATTDAILLWFVLVTRSTTAFVQSDLLTSVAPPYVFPWTYDGPFQRQTGLLKPVEGADLEIVGGQQISTGQPVGVSGRRLRLTVTTGSPDGFVPDGGTGGVRVADGQTFLLDAFPPTADPASPGNLIWPVITTSGVAGSLHTGAGNVTLIPADPGDAVVAEAAVISQTSVSGPITILSFDGPLLRIYDRTTVTVNANAASATQGETMHEILGSGDATNAALEFTLKQSPLTFVSSSVGQGASSTLQVWVNNLRWNEVDNFLAAGPADRVFVTHTDEQQKVTVRFGDGINGARTPTGQMNIRAVYRKGIGAAGNVQAGQLSQPLDRPQGLKGVTNPDAGTGGADPATAADARLSAPLHVLTLDRVVSLEDYQNFALAFAGIAKALATWTWSGRTRGVFLTVAGADGSTFEAGDPTIVKLHSALRGAGNPYVPIQVVSYEPVLFEIAAGVRIDMTEYDPTVVLRQVWRSLAMGFAFGQRQLGQGVAQSEVITLIQQTPGVIAVQLSGFNRQGQLPANPLSAVLRAAAPLAGQVGTPQGAEMLLLDPLSQGNIGVW
jgi:hypothetical protein